MKNIIRAVVIIVLVGIVIAYIAYERAFTPTASTIPSVDVREDATITTVAEDLAVPWEVRELPSAELLVTERTGDLLRIDSAGDIERLSIPAIATGGEGGLLGLVLHPDFETNSWLYVYRTTPSDSGRTNQVVRYVYNDDHSLSQETVLLDNIPGASYHDGGRLEFGPDGYLYVTTGDAGNTALAQDVDSLAGKILRMTDTGDVPPDNPFDNYTYSYGHRNPQGLAWDMSGRLWSTEHGRSGMQSGMDELNRIEAGSNYGWPTIEGDETAPDMVAPVIHSGADETWAPASLEIVGSVLYFTGLRGESLYRAEVSLDGSINNLAAYLRDDYGRLRTIRYIDDALYIMTSNTDGRGDAAASDDVLLRVPQAALPITR